MTLEERIKEIVDIANPDPYILANEHARDTSLKREVAQQALVIMYEQQEEIESLKTNLAYQKSFNEDIMKVDKKLKAENEKLKEIIKSRDNHIANLEESRERVKNIFRTI